MRNFAVINLNAIYKNALTVKNALPKTTKLCAVVKADAYGHGAEKCAETIYQIADSYAVAIAEEGFSLRLSGIRKDILILNPLFDSDIEKAVHLGLTATVSNAKQLIPLISESERQGRKVKVHIKVNTGMNRNGADSLEEIKDILNVASNSQSVLIDGVYSHFADVENDILTDNAVKRFLLANKLVKGYNNKVTCHISASGGFLRHFDFDMVRIGILLYGYKPFKGDRVNVKPVMKIYSPVVCERSLKRGESALYGSCPADFDTDLSVVRFGYADGLPRRKCSEIFNNRCMDVSAYRGKKNGKFFCVLSDADSVAEDYGTISYEVLTKCAIRAEKIYFK